jgi:UDP-N-acetyl-D-glucosamine dehydrogenase
LYSFKSVGIIGQGYVGQELAAACLDAGYDVHGIDTNQKLTQQLNKRFAGKNYKATTKFSDLQCCDVVVFAVPTNLKDNKPDYSSLKLAIEGAGPFICSRTLVVIESTVGVGFTRTKALPMLNKLTNRDTFYLAYVPERIDPGSSFKYSEINRVVAGLTSVDRSIANEFYQTLVSGTTLAESLEQAEAAKLLENSYRLVNIALVNQFNEACLNHGLNASSVVGLAATKPFGFMPFYPSAGVGGDCIPVDPAYLISSLGSIPLVEQSLAYNNGAPDRIISKIEKHLGKLSGKRLAIIGMSYKPNNAITNNSIGQKVLEKLVDLGVDAYGLDMYDSSSKVKPKTDLGVIVVKHSAQPQYDIDLLDVSEGI